jgi:Rap1a immunity proteins
MKIARWFSALALCALGISGPARAQQLTQDSFLLRNGGDLIALCSATQNDPLYTAAVNFCEGFVVGVVRVLHEDDVARGTGGLFCLPDPPPSRNQGIANLVQWAKSMPAQMNGQPADTVAAFLAQQFPCATPSRGARQ